MIPEPEPTSDGNPYSDPPPSDSPHLGEVPPSIGAPPSPAGDPPPSRPPLPPDPWAHRRGEPRVFAFLWTVYILLAVSGGILWNARFSPISGGSFSPAARIMLVVIAVGATILWPMVRLSQVSPRKGVLGHVLVDVVIVLTPIQFVLWPLIALSGWPVTIVLAIAGVFASWVALTGGLLALGLSGPSPQSPGDPALASRTMWMTIILACTCAAPLAMFGLHAFHTSTPRWLPALSPITAIPQLTGIGISGPQNPVTTTQFELIAATAAAALILWVAAFVRSTIGNRSNPA